MKHLLALLFFVSTFVHAAEIKVFEEPVDFFRPGARSFFAINMEMGRAWVEVEFFDPNRSNESGHGSAWYKQKVEGLSYNPSTSSIVLEKDGELIECATVFRGRFRTLRIRQTGCELVTRKVKLTFDDGYRSYKRDYHQVFLITK